MCVKSQSVWKQYQFKILSAPLPETSLLLTPRPQSRQGHTMNQSDLTALALRNLPDF